jgi:hypothetical protein
MGFGKPRCLEGAAAVWLLAAALCAAAAGLAAAEDGNAPPAAANQPAPAAPAAPAPPAAAPGAPAASAPATSGSGAPAASAPPAAPAPSAASAPASSTASAPPADRPGFLHQMREWWEKSISGLSAGMQDARSKVENLNQKSTEAVKNAATATQDAMKSTADATKGAASTLLKLPNTRAIEIRERCPPAPNGAPDCQTAATNACRGKGFSGGQPLDVVTAEKCPPAAMLSAQRPGETECPVETIVSRVLCR